MRLMKIMQAYLSTLRCFGDVDLRNTVSLGNAGLAVDESFILADLSADNNERVRYRCELAAQGKISRAANLHGIGNYTKTPAPKVIICADSDA